ncbi:hypothetical protein DPB93_07260 [Salmonella enterica subsp. salamae]|nr:hypothetical protein [Salmonella enterica subsp. salamae]ECI4075488.1 hypothetical protein [Salmonella enterica subsp. salamae]EEO2382991.1 hypothetical protein [Salmonella enterica]
MAEGLKMFYARHERDKSRRIPVAEIEQSDKKGLICEFCDAKIDCVKAHQRNGKNISAFLRLHKNESHRSNCGNIVKSAINALVAHSQSIEDGKPLIDNGESNFIFRMNVLIDATLTSKKAKIAMDEEINPEEKVRKRIRYQKAEKCLSDYFNTATGVARIRSKIEESTDKKSLSDLVKIVYDGKQISWNDFFYDEERYPVLFKKADKIKHPVAILITVKHQQKHVKTAKNEFYSLNGDVCVLENEDKTKDYFSPALTCNDETFFEKFQPGDEIVIVGNVRITTKPWIEGKTYKNLNFSIINKKQITRIKD